MLNAVRKPTPDQHPMEAARIRLEEAFLRLEHASRKRAEREAARAAATASEAKEVDIQRLEKECRVLKDDKEKLHHLLRAAEASRESVAGASQIAATALDAAIRKLQNL